MQVRILKRAEEDDFLYQYVDKIYIGGQNLASVFTKSFPYRIKFDYEYAQFHRNQINSQGQNTTEATCTSLVVTNMMTDSFNIEGHLYISVITNVLQMSYPFLVLNYTNQLRFPPVGIL